MIKDDPYGKSDEDKLNEVFNAAHQGSQRGRNHCSMEGGAMVPPATLSGDDDQLIATDSSIDETTHRLLFGNHGAQLGNELLNILHTVGILTTTVEGDSYLTILHVRDVLNGAGGEVELRHN